MFFQQLSRLCRPLPTHTAGAFVRTYARTRDINTHKALHYPLFPACSFEKKIILASLKGVITCAAAKQTYFCCGYSNFPFNSLSLSLHFALLLTLSLSPAHEHHTSFPARDALSVCAPAVLIISLSYPAHYTRVPPIICPSRHSEAPFPSPVPLPCWMGVTQKKKNKSIIIKARPGRNAICNFRQAIDYHRARFVATEGAGDD